MRERYRALLSANEIEPDPAQARVVGRLEELLSRLREASLARKGNALGWLFGRSKPNGPTRGLYVWGDVGRGKTMLMDLFYDAAPAALAKRRVHFNAFMNEVHERIFRHRNAVKAGEAKGDDPIPPVAEALAAEAMLLCFDEFAVTDIADAMILGRLFTELFERGMVVVATSNVEPDHLYEHGLNRSLFLPFVALLKRHMEVVKLESRTDYRMEKLAAVDAYVIATGEAARKALDAAFLRLAGSAHGRPRQLPVKGHVLCVPEAAMGVARMSFAELCERAVGPADYLALAEAFHTLLLDEVPVLRPEQRNEVKRFITLIDTLYDQGVKLVVSAAAEPAALYRSEVGREASEFRRTVSRLVEMGSQAYLARPHAPRPSTAPLVET